MEPRISIITLGVSDLKKSTEFYQKLGLPLQPGNNEISFFELQGTKLALFPRDLLAKDAKVENMGGGFSGITLAHNVKSKEEVKRVLEEAKKTGAEITKEPEDTDWGGYSGYFKDPDGYLWEVAFNPFFKID